MVGISSIRTPIGRAFDYTASKLSNTLEKARLEPAKYAGRLMVLSFISKDLVNTCFYTYQSLNNKQIPDEKRNFVAANDLVLGFFNFGGQILSYVLFEKLVTPIIQGKCFTGEKGNKKYSNAVMSPDSINKIAKEYMHANSERFKNYTPEQLGKIAEGVVEKCGPKGGKCKSVITGLTVIVGALATTALVKRTISPLFSTPIAGWLGNKWDKKAQDKKSNEQLNLSRTSTESYSKTSFDSNSKKIKY